MKILLVAINAKYIHSNLAVYSLRAYGREHLLQETATDNTQIVIREFTINQLLEEILRGIYEEQPQVIALSVYIWNRSMIGRILPEIHKVLPHAAIWLGGPEVSFDLSGQMKKLPMITGIMVGEGEATFAELATFYQEKEKNKESAHKLSEIAGIVYRDPANPEKIDITAMREVLPMDEIPFPYESLDNFENRILYYETSRGCPFSCAYCLSSVEKKLRFRSFEKVSEELAFFLRQRVPQVKFVDRTFNCNHEHAMQILQFIKENDNGVTNFHFEIAGDILTEEEIVILQSLRPGLVQLEIGVQSTHEATLEAINRRTNMELLRNNVERLLEPRNIHLHLDLIAGLPYEDLITFRQSFNEVFRMHGDELQLGFLKLLYGAPMKEKTKEYQIQCTEEPPYEILMNQFLSYEQVLELKDVEAMLENYYNSGQFTYTLEKVLQEEISPYEFFLHLALYYKKKDYPVMSVARVRRYEILLEYLEQMNSYNKSKLWDNPGDRMQEYRERLTLDYYLRENAKKRPDFAPQQETHDQTLIDFFREEAANPRILTDYEGFDAKQLQKMTHTERFRRILSADESKAPCIVLFDYRKRHPVTGAAGIELLHLIGGESH